MYGTAGWPLLRKFIPIPSYLLYLSPGIGGDVVWIFVPYKSHVLEVGPGRTCLGHGSGSLMNGFVAPPSPIN